MIEQATFYIIFLTFTYGIPCCRSRTPPGLLAVTPELVLGVGASTSCGASLPLVTAGVGAPENKLQKNVQIRNR